MDNENITNMIGAIATGDLSKAKVDFTNAIQDKIASTLETKRVEVAGSMFNGASDENIQTDAE